MMGEHFKGEIQPKGLPQDWDRYRHGSVDVAHVAGIDENEHDLECRCNGEALVIQDADADGPAYVASTLSATDYLRDGAV